MKILSIYLDIRKSKEMSFEKKIINYRKFYSQFSSYNPRLENINLRQIKYIGDGILLLFNADSLSNSSELIKLMKEIDNKRKTVQNSVNITIGVGMSYSIAHDDGQERVIAPSIDAASVGTNLAMKYKIKDQRWAWVIPLNLNDDNEGSLDELVEIITESPSLETRKSSSKKNLWINVL